MIMLAFRITFIGTMLPFELLSSVSLVDFKDTRMGYLLWSSIRSSSIDSDVSFVSRSTEIRPLDSRNCIS